MEGREKNFISMELLSCHDTLALRSALVHVESVWIPAAAKSENKVKITIKQTAH